MNQTIKIELPTTVMQSSTIISADLGGEAVMMQLESYRYFGLDEIATQIWEMMSEPISVANLCDQLLLQYEVERATCERDLLAYLNGLLNDGLLAILPTK